MLPLRVSYQELPIKLNIFHYTHNKLFETGFFTSTPNVHQSCHRGFFLELKALYCSLSPFMAHRVVSRLFLPFAAESGTRHTVKHFVGLINSLTFGLDFPCQEMATTAVCIPSLL